MTEAEISERRKSKRLAKGLDLFSDSYGDEDDEMSGTVEGRNGSDTIVADKMTGRSARGRGKKKVQVMPVSAEHPPCPEGFDPDKWAAMSLEQKCAHLGIDLKEWLKMTREQQMQRMHNMANNFHFYAIDKVTDEKKYASGKKWHF